MTTRLSAEPMTWEQFDAALNASVVEVLEVDNPGRAVAANGDGHYDPHQPRDAFGRWSGGKTGTLSREEFVRLWSEAMLDAHGLPGGPFAFVAGMLAEREWRDVEWAGLVDGVFVVNRSADVPSGRLLGDVAWATSALPRPEGRLIVEVADRASAGEVEYWGKAAKVLVAPRVFGMSTAELAGPREAGFVSSPGYRLSASRYTLAHEWGHASDPVSRAVRIGRDPGQAAMNRHAQLGSKGHVSVYAQQNRHEAFAESWVEWHLGDRSHPTAAAYAKEYGW